MKITKTSSSITQKIMFTTIKELEDYIVITYPIGFNLEIKGKFIHVRENEKNKDWRIGRRNKTFI